MTLGQRIQELRKKAGLSQEGLGEALGVSRQAVSKWEGDNGIPELDTLVAISRLFGVPLGELLGVEPPAATEETPPASLDEEKVEAVLRRYVEESRRHEQARRPVIWPWVVSLCCAVAAIVAVTVSVGQVREVKHSVNTLWNNVADIENIVSNVRNQVGGLSEEIRNTLEEGARLISTCESEVVAVDIEKQEVTLRLTATLKDYAADSKLQFLVDWIKVDETKGQTASDWVTGPDFMAEIVLPMNFHSELSIRVEDGAGNMREQALVDYLYHLHPDSFKLDAYDLLKPFIITISRFGLTSITAQGEHAYVDILSAYPDLYWPEEAVITAYLNKEAIFTEAMNITQSEDSRDMFCAAIQDKYYEVTLKEGDSFIVVVRVTDNLGRVEEFTHSGTVNDGVLRQQPMEAPAVRVD